MSKGKGQTDLARERLVREINRLGVVRRNGRSRKVNWPDPHGPGRWGASVRNAAETFGLDCANLLEALGELDDAWGLEVLSDW
jgi:hypothetical protein